jgi:mannose-1-phosphate guanylyltransferase
MGLDTAMILAAGFGRRVEPLSLVRPKPLFPVLNRPIIARTLDRLAEIGVKKAVVNTHHLADRVAEYLATGRFDLQVITVFEPTILGTGGGVKNAAAHLGDKPFFLINADIVFDLDLAAAAEAHLAKRPTATLVLHDDARFNQVAVDGSMRIRGFRTGGGEGLDVLAFTGVHILEPETILALSDGFHDIIPVYQSLIDAGLPVMAHRPAHIRWWDIGTPRRYLEAHGDLLSERGEGPFLVSPEARISPRAVLEGWAAIGPGAVVEAGAKVTRTVLWPHARAAAGAALTDCVVADGAIAYQNAEGRAVVDDGRPAEAVG